MELKTQVKQKITLSAHMQQCLEILAMDNTELGEFITEQSMENPIIELSEAPASWQCESLAAVHIERRLSEEEERGQEIADRESPNRDLYLQLSEYRLPSEVRRAAEYIIESLDERGYFADNVKESAAVLKTSVKNVKKALETVKKLEPKGIGAAGLEECLLMQLESEYPWETIAKEIVEKYLDDFSKGRLDKIGKSLGKTQEQIKKAGEIIRSLNPKPLRSREPVNGTRYIIADLALVTYEDYYDIVLNQAYLPEIHFNNDYVELMKTGADEETRLYVRERYERAKWLKSCVEKRQDTLLAVAGAIFKEQREFLLAGPPEIRPLTLKHVAEEMGVNISTISRAVKGKYIQTKWGTYPLKYFFGGGIPTEGGSVSTAHIRAVIARMIAKEDKEHPFSDSRIEKLLKERGMSVSRRTVAAYREQMGLPSSPERKAEHLYRKKEKSGR